MWSPLNIVHAGLNLVRSGLEDFDESATAIVISPEMAKMVGLIFVASESAIDLLNYEHIDSGSGSSSSSYQQGNTVLMMVVCLCRDIQARAGLAATDQLLRKEPDLGEDFGGGEGNLIEVDNGMISMGSRGPLDSISKYHSDRVESMEEGLVKQPLPRDTY